MILNVAFRGKYLYAAGRSEISSLVDRIMENMREELVEASRIVSADEVIFSFAEGQCETGTTEWWPDNYLHVTINPSTGYGALVWYTDVERAEKAQDEISEYTWVSDNPTPPTFDPRVTSDPYDSSLHDPRSTIPIPLVREALEEFCAAETGDRPKSIQWVRSIHRGERMD